MPAWEQLTLEGVHANGTSIVIRARSKRKPRCPACAGSAVSYHSQYERRLRDLPCLGQPVQLRLRLRRFRCRNRECPQKIFAERLPAIAAPRARETCRMGEMLGVTGYVLGGLPAHRLLQCWGIGISRDTILRRMKSQSRVIPTPKVRVLGVDDWAWRKRQHYGTMLMNLESRRVIDLLPVRSASSFADWLRHHPEIEIITRDRSTLYADGGRQGAPTAVQVLDRYHLVKNLSEAMERDVQQMQIQARAALRREAASPNGKPKRLTLIEARRQRCREARYQRYLAVINLRRQGDTQLAIAANVASEVIAGETVPVFCKMWSRV